MFKVESYFLSFGWGIHVYMFSVVQYNDELGVDEPYQYHL